MAFSYRAPAPLECMFWHSAVCFMANYCPSILYSLAALQAVSSHGSMPTASGGAPGPVTHSPQGQAGGGEEQGGKGQE